MRYTVIWLRPAEAELARIWLGADDRDVISHATNGIDQLLKVQPHTAGESRSEGKRILLVAPLGVTFRVDEDDRLVRVADVWRFRTRP